MMFCRDVDLLYWEPDVIKEAALASQTLDSGTGDVTGTAFALVTGTPFNNQRVERGQVIVLGGAIAGCFAITSTSPFQLEISVLYDELFPESGAGAGAVGVGTAAGVTFSIRSFWAQRQVVSALLMQSVGIVPGTEQARTAVVLNPESLRRACVLGTLQMIYATMAAAASEPAKFSVRADLYERLYRRALRAAQVDLDLDGDGRADARRCPGLMRIVRE